MNPLTNVKNLSKLNERELTLGISGQANKSWHQKYKDSAWIFVGGIPYDLTEGDVISVFSQYGEIVNINLIRDRKTGKSRGFGFLCYEDQRSTILAVDNFNGIKLLNRTIRVDHVEEYRVPKLHDDIDEATKQLWEEGCAPKALERPSHSGDELLPLDVKPDPDESEMTKKKTKKQKKHKKHKHSTKSPKNELSDEDSTERKRRKKIKRETDTPRIDPKLDRIKREIVTPQRETNEDRRRLADSSYDRRQLAESSDQSERRTEFRKRSESGYRYSNVPEREENLDQELYSSKRPRKEEKIKWLKKVDSKKETEKAKNIDDEIYVPKRYK